MTTRGARKAPFVVQGALYPAGVSDDENVIPIGTGKKPTVDGRPRTSNNSAERMRELVEIRKRKAAERRQAREEALARGELPPLDPTKIKPLSEKEIRERALTTAADLFDRARVAAVNVLTEQLNHKDPAIRQRAATKILEYTDGKPTQTIIATNDTVTKVVYETAALMNAGGFVPGFGIDSA